MGGALKLDLVKLQEKKLNALADIQEGTTIVVIFFLQYFKQTQLRHWG
jgi:hypothetical protein